MTVDELLAEWRRNPAVQREARAGYRAWGSYLTTARSLRGLPPQLLAERAFNAAWPPVVQHLYQACVAARLIKQELDAAARTLGLDSERLRELAERAYTQWQDIERYAGLIVTALEMEEPEP